MDIRKELGTAALGVVLLYSPMILVHGLCLLGTGWEISGVEFFLLIPMLGMVGLPLAFIGLPFERLRPKAATLGLLSGALVVTFVPLLLLAEQLRHQGFKQAAQRARPLIEAIERHVQEEGRPPATLESLIPDYISEIPSGLPPLEIEVYEERWSYGNQWSLSAEVSTGLLNWDMFLYFPNGNYPETGYGGWLERIEDWAYVHE